MDPKVHFFYRFKSHMCGSAVLGTVEMNVRTDITWIYCASIWISVYFLSIQPLHSWRHTEVLKGVPDSVRKKKRPNSGPQKIDHEYGRMDVHL